MRDAIAGYQKLLELYNEIIKQLTSGGSSVTLQALVEESRILGKEIRSADDRFQKLAFEKKIALADIPLYSEWRVALNRASKENERMSRRLKAGLTVLENELQQLGSTKKVISRYRSGRDERGRQIDISSA